MVFFFVIFLLSDLYMIGLGVNDCFIELDEYILDKFVCEDKFGNVDSNCS